MTYRGKLYSTETGLSTEKRCFIRIFDRRQVTVYSTPLLRSISHMNCRPNPNPRPTDEFAPGPNGRSRKLPPSRFRRIPDATSHGFLSSIPHFTVEVY